MVTVVGGGLAGCEAAWQLAERGIDVLLVEQKPLARTPAQSSDALCELVCSNSMRGAAIVNAVGLLKEELRRAGSLILAGADLAKVPAGGALAVDRDVFSRRVTVRIDAHPRIRREAAIVRAIPDATESSPVILATGPLTGDELATDLAAAIGVSHLAYYDAIAPIVATDSIDEAKVFRQSRWGKGAEADEGDRDATALGDEAYINCPMDEVEYRAFVAAIVAAEKVEPRAFEETKYFEGCLPIEIMAGRGEMTLAFGPMKPVGLTDPRTGRRPFAVVQLRQEDEAATAYNLVGFQTRMTYGAQARVFRMIPGLEDAEISRYGSVHRNTFVDAPEQLRRTDAAPRAPARLFGGTDDRGRGVRRELRRRGSSARVMLAQTPAGRAARSPSTDVCARWDPHAPRAQAAALPAVEHHIFAHPALRKPPTQEA